MHIDEAPLLEKSVDGISTDGADTEYCLEGVCPGTQMGHGPQIFHGVALLLQGIIRGGSSLHQYLLCLDLKGLLCLRCCHQLSLYDNGRPHIELGDLGKIRHGIMIYDLKGLEEGAVIQHDKPEAF